MQSHQGMGEGGLLLSSDGFPTTEPPFSVSTAYCPAGCHWGEPQLGTRLLHQVLRSPPPGSPPGLCGTAQAPIPAVLSSPCVPSRRQDKLPPAFYVPLNLPGFFLPSPPLLLQARCKGAGGSQVPLSRYQKNFFLPAGQESFLGCVSCLLDIVA